MNGFLWRRLVGWPARLLLQRSIWPDDEEEDLSYGELFVGLLFWAVVGTLAYYAHSRFFS